MNNPWIIISFDSQLELLPELIAKRIVQHQQQQQQHNRTSISNEVNNVTNLLESRRNFLHPEYSVSSSKPPLSTSPSSSFASANNPVSAPAPLMHNQTVHMQHSQSVPPSFLSSSQYHWPTSPILPPISSRTPHLVPEPLQPNSWECSPNYCITYLDCFFYFLDNFIRKIL